jgi:hypothetical protein
MANIQTQIPKRHEFFGEDEIDAKNAGKMDLKTSPNGPRGRGVLSLRMNGPECNVRPFLEAQTRRAREARLSIVAGANGRVSGTGRLSG